MRRTVFVALYLVAFAGLGCEESSSPSSCPDTGGTDVPTTTPDTTGPSGDAATDATQTDTGPTARCEMGKITCGDGETDVYGVCVADVRISLAGGTFTMGRVMTGYPDTGPEHEVTVSPFFLDRVEVTNRLWAACVACGVCDAPVANNSYSGREPYYGADDYADYPVVFVTWDQAHAFCDGLDKRLPTEAEWEFAARGGQDRVFPWGDESPSSNHANYGYVYGDTMGVDGFTAGASADGALSLAGNVWEWVADNYAADYYQWSESTDPQGPPDGASKVARGGSFGSGKMSITTFVRTSYLLSDAFSNVGFRCAGN